MRSGLVVGLAVLTGQQLCLGARDEEFAAQDFVTKVAS